MKIWDGDKTYLDLFFQDIRLLVEELQCSFLQLFFFFVWVDWIIKIICVDIFSLFRLVAHSLFFS